MENERKRAVAGRKQEAGFWLRLSELGWTRAN